MLNKKRHMFYTLIGFICGALILCIFATLQKVALGVPLILKGYTVPFIFGGLAGATIGYYIAIIKRYNLLLKERVNTLESLLPICSSCKKIRTQGSDAQSSDSWQSVETYISSNTSSSFTHGICPQCRDELYQEYLDKDK